MKKNYASRVSLVMMIAGVTMLWDSCTTVPLTDRTQLSLIPPSSMLSMSAQEYDDFLKANPPSTNQAQTQLVKKVGKDIQVAVEQYLAQKNLSDRLSGYDWEFTLVENKEANAWCMPGGKVVVYSGILPVTQDETGLAVVLGHEIAHAIAEHGSERMSQAMIAQLGGVALAEALKTKPDQTRQIWLSVFGAGAQYGALLPFSRLQESEADHLGLIFMSMAGYTPDASVQFWQRMAQAKAGQAPPEFMSTHPADQTRIDDLNKELPEAMQYYRGPK